MEELKKILSAFKLRDLYTFINILKVLDQHDKTIKDLIDFVSWIEKNPEKLIKAPPLNKLRCKDTQIKFGRVKPTHACRLCDTSMLPFSVNTSRCNQVGGGYKIQWICPKCDEEEFE